jgi:hypothetical protein
MVTLYMEELLTGARINADDATPSCGLFLTCRGQNMYSIIQ